MFNRFNRNYLKLAKAAYGGELYLEEGSCRTKEIELPSASIKKTPDIILQKKGISGYFSYKNPESGFCAVLFEHKEKNKLIIAFRGTERVSFGENASDFAAWAKDIAADLNFITGALDRQFNDAWEFYSCVKKMFPKTKIVLLGHSLGGALAQITAAKAYSETYKGFFSGVKLETYTYNAPGCARLLKIFNCREDLDYSFIKNYSVMNDWCGMFGRHAGSFYLMPPVPVKDISDAGLPEIFNNILLSTHEGIFDCAENTRIIKNNGCFQQAEGLSLWYYDKNNPVKNIKKPQRFLSAVSSKFNFTPLEHLNKYIKADSEKTAQSASGGNFKDKFFENVNYTFFKTLAGLLEKTMDNISPESLKTALDAVQKYKMQPDDSYIEDMKSVLKECI